MLRLERGYLHYLSNNFLCFFFLYILDASAENQLHFFPGGGVCVYLKNMYPYLKNMYRLNILQISALSMFSVSLTFDKTLLMQFCYFICKTVHFFGYKCVSIQNSTWIHLHSAIA